MAVILQWRRIGAAVVCRQVSAGDSEAEGQAQAEFGRQPQGALPQCADSVIYFVGHLQHPLHTATSLGMSRRSRREWDHTLAMVPGAA